METIKAFIANTAVRWFKNLGFFGRQRFWVLYWAYRLTGWHIRFAEWDFVLEYLPELHDKMPNVAPKLLDVGCAKSLFSCEVIHRGYLYSGIDVNSSEIYFPKYGFKNQDIRTYTPKNANYNFVTCISVLEHIETGKEDALRNMVNILIVGGRLLLTIPTKEFAQQGHPWEGFTYTSLKELLPNNCVIIDYCERAGQICCAIERTE